MLSAVQSIWRRRGSLKRSVKSKSDSIKAQKSEALPFLSHAHTTPLSVRQSRSPNKCPHPAVSRWGCRGKRCQIIWQAKWDVSIRSSTPTQAGAKVSRGNPSSRQTSATETRPPYPIFFIYLSAPLSRNTLLVHFPCRRCRKPAGYKMNHELVVIHSENLHKNVIKNCRINIKYVHRD